jgi:hypothetical protein
MHDRIPTANELYFSDIPLEGRRLETLETRFFQSVGLPNGTWKTTSYRRLDDLNTLVQSVLPAERPLDVMDVAVSSGVSTLEWLESLERAGIQCRMTAGDAAADAYLVTMGRGLRVLVDRRGTALQYEVSGRAIRLPVRKRELLRHGLAVLYMRTMLNLFVAPALKASRQPEEGARMGISWRPLKLVSPMLRKHKRIEVVEDDILVNRGYRECFHVLRAANILNRGYFDESTLTAMLLNLRGRLRKGGLLIVCRTTNEGNVNNGSILALGEKGRFHLVSRLNAGSEVEDLALSLPDPI